MIVTGIRIRGLLAAALLVVAAGCGGDDEDTDEAAVPTSPPAETEMEEEPPPTETEEPATEETEAATEEAAPAAEVTVAVAESSLGTILVDADGLSLYMFDPDAQGASTCYDACASLWPPLVVDGDPVAGDGVDQDLLGTAERDDGALQVTYDGWPLYTWSQDAAAGDVNGQGVEGVWWVIGPDGAPIRD